MNIKEEKSIEEKHIFQGLLDAYKNNPILDSEVLSNLHLFIRLQDLKRTLFFGELYKLILNVPGDIIEFGVRWGGDMVLLQNLRGIYEPFNHSRKIIGFDTFSGFPSVSQIDNAQVGNYSVTNGYETFLEKLLSIHESFSPLSHIKKFQLLKGDVFKTLPPFLDENKNQCFSLIYFDLDLYEPTKFCLENILSHITKGSVVVFDDFNGKSFRGESLAVKEVFKGFKGVNLKCHPLFQRASYLIVE